VEEHTNLAFRSWDDICKPPEQGGLGIRDTRLINNCFIIRSAWNIATNKNIVAILKAKYYPDNTFWTASNTTFIFVYWSSILQVNITFTPMPFYKFTMETPPHGIHLGLRIGNIYMIII
jgi:hypothetical protein